MLRHRSVCRPTEVVCQLGDTEMNTACDYDGFIALLRDRKNKLGLAFTELNDLAGLPGGYANKILLGSHRKGPYSAIGPESLAKLLRALGIEIQIVPAVAGSSANASYPQALLRERARLGGLARYSKMTPRQVREFARKGGLASAAKRKVRK